MIYPYRVDLPEPMSELTNSTNYGVFSIGIPLSIISALMRSSVLMI